MAEVVLTNEYGASSEASRIFASYDLVAGEYYDNLAHPTCFNFNRLSRLYIAERFPEAWGETPIIEVGAGDSAVAAVLHSKGLSLNRLEITDGSPAMLAYSRRWRDEGASTRVCPASKLGSSDGKYAGVISSLGDPYNTLDFWLEANRVLAPGGRVIFTIPSYEWSRRFRRHESSHSAEFIVDGGRTVALPSFILTLSEQVKMMETCGFSIIHFESLGRDRLPYNDPVSRKLFVFDEGQSSIVWGFELLKHSRLT